MQETYPVNRIFGGVPDKHPAASAFRDVPCPRASTLLYVLLPLILGLVLAIAACFWLAFHREETARAGFFPFLCGFVVWIAFMWGGVQFGQVLQRKRFGELDQSRLGKRILGETYVGIAYAEGCWRLREDMAWDRGYLSASADGLRFRGHASGFALPAHAIRAVRLETSTMAPHQRVPRIFVDWTSPDGEDNTFSLDTRPVWFDRSAIRAVERLRNMIADALRQPAERPLSPVWPPAVRLERLDLRASLMKINLRDLVALPIGLVLGLVVMVIIEVAILALPMGAELRRTLFNGFRHIAPQIPMIGGVACLIRRIVIKYKALPAPDQAVADPMPRAVEAKEASVETVQLRS